MQMDTIEAERTLPARSLDFWFDYTCPYAYLGSTQARALAERMNVPLTYRPLLLGGVFKAIGQEQNLAATRSPQRIAHDAADLQRWAARLGVTLVVPSSHPMRSVEALRATLATGIDPKVVDAFFRAYWVEGRPISSAEVVREIVSCAGHDARAIEEKIQTSAVKDDLRKRTEEGIALGIFGVPAWVVDGAHLYWGQDRLAFVEGVVRPRPEHRRKRNGEVDLYWDFSSPFAYLAMTQARSLSERTGARVRSKPILLGGLFKALGGPEVPLATFSPAKQAYILKDVHRWAAYWKQPFRFPSTFPVMALKALRTYLALPDDAREAFCLTAFRAAWAEDRDLTNDAVLASCIGDEARARDAFARAGSDAVKAELRANTEEAAKRGVFGVPTFAIGDALYWGQDRIDLVEEALTA
jgi:2-hydroxychromene-2-carboxylate isomerase